MLKFEHKANSDYNLGLFMDGYFQCFAKLLGSFHSYFVADEYDQDQMIDLN